MPFQISARIKELGLMACTIAGKYESMLPLDMVQPIINSLEAIIWFVTGFKQANVRINVFEDVLSELCQYLTAKHFLDLESETDVQRAFFNSFFVKNLKQ